MDSITVFNDLQPIISLKALEKSGRVLKAFSLIYLPFHGLPLEELFEYYGTFAFVSASIYQVDELNERGEEKSTPPLDEIRTFLLRRGLLDDSTAEHLNEGELYLAFERRLRRESPQDLEEIVTAMKRSSSDFRLLHCLLHRFLEKPYCASVFDAFASLEMLMEMDDDISSYEEDVAGNTFNFLRGLKLLRLSNVRETAESLRSRVICQIEEFSSTLPQPISARYSASVETYLRLVPTPSVPTTIDRQ